MCLPAATLHMDRIFGLSAENTLTGGGVGGGCKLLLDALEDSAHPAGQGHWGHRGHGHSLGACTCTSLLMLASWEPVFGAVLATSGAVSDATAAAAAPPVRGGRPR